MNSFYKVVVVRKDENEDQKTLARKKTERGALKLIKVLRENNQIDEENYRLEIQEEPIRIEYNGDEAEVFMGYKQIDILHLDAVIKAYLDDHWNIEENL